jgi:hypothetical protein
VVREESHLDEMRVAIRGDFERLERRRGGQALMQAPPNRPITTERADDEPEPDGAQARSWLSRLLGR